MSNDKPLTFNLKKQSDLDRLSSLVKNDIDLNAQKKYDDGFRSHLGGSRIGEKCRRRLWYEFRWCGREKFSGRMLRLFNRGHREEERNVEWLRDIGFTVWDTDQSQPQNPDGTYPQFRVSACGGHFGGSTDGIVQFPQHYGELPYMLYECKTNATGGGFNKLSSDGFALAKPMHWAQTCTYGYLLGLDYVLYTNTNKNDDDIYVEVKQLDKAVGAHMVQKAEDIIIATDAPNRMSDSPTHYECKACPMHGVCHSGELPLVNCRSCKHSSPVDNKEWYCSVHNSNIPKEVIKEACGSYEPITVC